MNSKRQARVFALQCLYAKEITGLTLGEVLPGVIESLKPLDDQKRYGMKIMDLAIEFSSELDQILVEYAIDWEPERMPVLDRLALHLALTELKQCADVPVRVVLQEWIQIVRKYSTEDSGSFVNGILDRYAKQNSMLKSQDDPTSGDQEVTVE